MPRIQAENIELNGNQNINLKNSSSAILNKVGLFASYKKYSPNGQIVQQSRSRKLAGAALFVGSLFAAIGFFGIHTEAKTLQGYFNWEKWDTRENFDRSIKSIYDQTSNFPTRLNFSKKS